MRAFACAVVWLLCCYSANAADANIYIFAGQSNSVGWGQPAAVTPRPEDNRIRLYAELATSDLFETGERDGTVDEAPPGDKPSLPRWLQDYPIRIAKFGPVLQGGIQRAGAEISFARRLGRNHNAVVAKFAVAGSSLHDDWMHAKGVDLSDRLVMFLSRVLRDVGRQGDTPKVRALIWFQGESDTLERVTAKAYRADLQQLIRKVRGFVENDNLPVVIVRTHKGTEIFGGPPPHLSMVRRAQENIATDDRCAVLVNTDDVPLLPDKVHFAQNEHAIIGARQYAALLKMTPRC